MFNSLWVSNIRRECPPFIIKNFIINMEERIMLNLSAVEQKILEVCERVKEDYKEYEYESFVYVYEVPGFTYFLSYASNSEMSPKEATQHAMEAIRKMDPSLYHKVGVNYDDSHTDFFEV